MRRFFCAKSSREERAKVVRHLVANCRVCRGSLSAFVESRWLLSRLLEMPEGPCQSSAAEVSYEWAFARVNRTVLGLMERAQCKVRDPVADLLLMPRAKLLTEVRKMFTNPEAVRNLLARSFVVRYSDPKQMLLLAQLAKRGADWCESGVNFDGRMLADLRAQASSNLASALRVTGRLREAQQALGNAEMCCSQGTGDPLVLAYVLERKTVVQYSLGCFEEAVTTASAAAKIYAEAGKTTLAASVAVSQAIALHYSGRSEEAIQVLNRTIPLLDTSTDSLLVLSAYHNLAAALLGSGQVAEAIAVLDSVRDLYKDHSDITFRLRARALQADILLAIGHLESAERAILEASEGLSKLGLDREAAFATLTLAEVYSKQGAVAALRKLLTKALPLLRSFDLGPGPRDALVRLETVAGLASTERE